MRKIIVTMFVTMDGVLQAPGGPEEDTSNQFKWGGWTFPFSDDITDNILAGIMSRPFDLLLGRRTYEIFAAYWPYQESGPIADKFNAIKKYVVSSKNIDLPWQHSALISGDVVTQLNKLKEEDGPNLLVHGSSRLVQTLLAYQLIDDLYVWTLPLTLGTGKKLFEEGTQPLQWKVTDTKVSTKGVIIAHYVPDGKIKTGSFPSDKVSDAELARRKKHSQLNPGNG